MLIDELVKESFDLDYEITYKQKAVDFLKEELKYIERDDIIELISKLTMKIQNLENYYSYLSLDEIEIFLKFNYFYLNT